MAVAVVAVAVSSAAALVPGNTADYPFMRNFVLKTNYSFQIFTCHDRYCRGRYGVLGCHCCCCDGRHGASTVGAAAAGAVARGHNGRRHLTCDTRYVVVPAAAVAATDVTDGSIRSWRRARHSRRHVGAR